MSKARKISSFGKTTAEYEKAIIYCRVSSDRQRTEGHGLESQEQRCREFAKQRGYEVVEVFKDSYTGGGDFHDRPELTKLFQFIDLNAHQQYVVLIDDLSRFARDVNAHFLLKKELRSKDVGLECTNFNFEDTPEGELIETLMAAQHQYHRKNNRRQVIQKQKARLESGYWAFGSKKAYKMVSDPVHGKISVPLEPEASILRKAFEGFATGRFIHKVEVCQFLVESGFWTKQKPERYIDKLTLIFKDSFYAGFIEYPMWDVSRRISHHRGIISLELFEATQKRLNQKSRSGRTRIDVSDVFPLRGLIVCDCCQKPLTGAYSTGRSGKYPYYRCQNKECEFGKVSIKASDVHSGFDKVLEKQKLKLDVEEVLKVIFDRVWKEEIYTLNMAESISRDKIKEIERKIKQMTEMAVKAKSEKVRAVYEKQVEEYAIEIEELQKMQTSELDLSVPYRTALDKSTQLLKSPYKIWQSLDIHEQHRLFFFIFDEKLPYSKKAGYRTDNLPCAVRLFEDFVTSNSQDVDTY